MEALLPVSRVVPVFLKPVFPTDAEESKLPDPEPGNLDVEEARPEEEGDCGGLNNWGPERIEDLHENTAWYHCPNCRFPIERVDEGQTPDAFDSQSTSYSQKI